MRELGELKKRSWIHLCIIIRLNATLVVHWAIATYRPAAAFRINLDVKYPAIYR